MDLAAARSWASQPDVCRCCLSANGTWDLTASYINDGVKEVFSEMVRQCFGIKLSRLTEWGPSRLLCRLCATHLRDACAFRKQVIDSERCFEQYYEDKDGGVSVKFDLKVKSESEEDANLCTELLRAETDYDSDKKTVTKVKIISEKENSNKRKKIKATKKRRKMDSTSKNSSNDLEAPVEKILNSSCEKNHDAVASMTDIQVDNVTNKITDKNCLEDETDEAENVILYNVHNMVKPKICVKQISERKRLMLTCHTVLKYTSACPFRHFKSWFQCFFCHLEFMGLNMLRHHILKEHISIEDELKKIKRYPRSLQIDISELKCLKCELNLDSVDLMKDHLLQTHDELIFKECIADYKVDTSPFKCHLCKQEFHVFRSLTVHLNDHYANCICDVCGKSFLNSKRLKVHKRTHESGLFPCKECDKVLKTKTSKANHIENFHSKRILKCHICLKPMKHYNDRIKHMSEVHQVTHTFKCPICPKEYNIKHYLATHIRQTHGSKNKKCKECSMAFITNHGLKKHMLKHSGEKPYTCSVCGKAYARSYTLKEHMRAHESDKR